MGSEPPPNTTELNSMVGSPEHSPQITTLLRAWEQGDESALERLTPLVYDELKSLARRRMSRENDGHTLQATALIHEVYLRLVEFHDFHWKDRAHFFAICARLMRRILVDFARARNSGKRGGQCERLPLADSAIASPEYDLQLLDLEAALEKLAQMDSRKTSIVELRFFGGLTVQETAQVLQLSPDTVMRDWSLARGWLLREMERGQSRAD